MAGTVTDPADAVVPRAALIATELTTGNVHTVSSDDSGLFRFNDLPPGPYTLRVQASGFKALNLNGLDLPAGETRAVGKLVLQIGSLSDKVEVTAESTPVQTASSERSTSVLPQQLRDLSLKGRDPFAFVQLLPGVVDSNVGQRDVENAYSMGYLSINGSNPRSVNMAIDGMSSMDGGGNWSAFVSPNMDAISEMRILTNGYSAEYGRQSGGTMNVITKGGGKDFHGSAHWDHRHEDLNANSFFNNRQNIQRALYRLYVQRVWQISRRNADLEDRM